MKRVLRWLFVIALVFQFSPSFSQVKPEAFHDIELRLKLTSTLIKAHGIIKGQFPDWQKELVGPSISQKWIKEFRKITEDYVEEQMINAEPNLKPGFFKKISHLINWNTLAELYRQCLDYGINILRVRGPTLFATIALVNVAQFVAGYFFAKMGMGIWAMVVLKIPVTVPIILAFDEAEKLAHRMKIYLQFGFSERRTLNRLLNLDKVAVEALDIDKISDLVIPLAPESQQALSLKKFGMIDNIFHFFGFNQGRLTEKRLQKFMKQNSIEDKSIQAILKSDKVSRESRLAMATTQLYVNFSPSEAILFKLKFHKNFIRFDENFDIADIESWLKALINQSQDIDSFSRLITKPPKNLGRVEFLKIWEDILIPYFGRELSVADYEQMRRLVRNYSAFKIQSYRDNELQMDEKFLSSFKTYFLNSMSKDKDRCIPNPQSILLKLRGS